MIDESKRIAAVSASSRSRKWTDESRAKLSASCRGRVYGRDVIEKTRAKNRKPVECVELKAFFDSVSEAAEGTGVSITSVSRVCLGKRNSANGFTFRFVNI